MFYDGSLNALIRNILIKKMLWRLKKYNLTSIK